MQQKNRTTVTGWISALFQEYKVPLVSAWVIGLAAHGYALTNKLVNHDEVFNLFDKGATISSGRWGLEPLRLVFPDYSIPWLYGLLTLLMVSASVCVIIKMFRIRTPLLQGLLSGLVITFPSLTGTLSYMFTAAPYALAFLLAVAAAAVYEKGGIQNVLAAGLLLFFSMSIYQTYVALTASFLVMTLICRMLTEEDDNHSIIRSGIKRVIFLSVVLVAYYLSVELVLMLTETDYNAYADNNFKAESVNLIRRIYVAYVNFLYFFTRRNWGLISSPLSLVMHLLIAAACVISVPGCMKKRKPSQFLLLAFLVAAQVLAMNCMYLIMEEGAIHTLVLYGFVSVYVLAVVFADRLLFDGARRRKLMAAAMAVVIAVNTVVANISYLRLHLDYEHAYSFYTSVAVQIRQTPGFDEESVVALIGDYQTDYSVHTQFPDTNIMGFKLDLTNSYSRQEFMRHYLAFEIPFATEEQIEHLSQTAEFAKMPIYPYYGSIREIDGYIVVKFSDIEAED